MAIARRKMLGSQWTAEETVDYLMDWTATKTNGLSTSADTMDDPKIAKMLRDEYGRICIGITSAVHAGKIPLRRRKRSGRPLTQRDATWIFGRTANAVPPAERYRREVFVFLLLGYTKDRGQRVAGPARYAGTGMYQAQIPGATMQEWPSGAAGAYRRRLKWATDSELVQVVRNYRHSHDPTHSRARTYEIEVDEAGWPATALEGERLRGVAQAASTAKRRRVHPRQVEHALYAAEAFPTSLKRRYGAAAARRIRGLVALHASWVASQMPKAA